VCSLCFSRVLDLKPITNFTNSVSICLKWSGLDLTPWNRVLLEKLSVAHMINKFPFFYGTRKFITMFTRPHLCIQFWASVIHVTPPYPISLKSVLILSSHLRLGLGLFIFGFRTKMLHTFLMFPMRAPPGLLILSSSSSSSSMALQPGSGLGLPYGFSRWLGVYDVRLSAPRSTWF
jgi:hypothetical protein